MKIFIINREKNDKIEINCNECSLVQDIKYKLDEILHGKGSFTRKHYRLIYKNFILQDKYSFKHYNICEKDEICFGKIENYLRKDKVIVYVFIFGYIIGYEYLMVKMNYTISTIRSIIERIYSEIINIWNADGKQMKNDQVVTEIDRNENYKLIIRYDDREGNVINKTFEQCCYLHDRRKVDRYLFWDQIRDDNKNKLTNHILIYRMLKIKQIISSNGTIDDRLNQDLSDLPSSFINSINFFCRDMIDRIVDICNDYCRFVINQYETDVVRIVDQYFPFAIRAALWKYSDFRQNCKTKTKKLISDILIDAVHYFLQYLLDSSNDWRYWLKLWMDQYLLGSISESDVNERIDKYSVNKFTVKIRMDRKCVNHFITSNLENIIQAKQLISKEHNMDMKNLYCIKPGGDHKLNDEDKFDDEFIIEIVMSMEDIEILKSLGRGGFAKIFLCRDKISNKQFVLKRPIKNDVDLNREINIYSKLNSSSNIMNLTGLFKVGENICIGLEYLSGGSLSSYFENGKLFSEQEIVRISYEILSQINELHKLGIIHRDIKSDNIVLDEHNHAKLIDFGISKCTTGLTSKYLLDKLEAYDVGTMRYMAPELIKQEPYSDKIDIWSFGMVMVEMVTGKRPFHWIKSPVPKIRDCTKYVFEPIIPISIELTKFINLCLNANPDERPSVECLIQSELFIDYLNENKIV